MEGVEGEEKAEMDSFIGGVGGVGGVGAAAGAGGGGISRVATANTFLPVLGSENMVESGWILTRKSVFAAFFLKNLFFVFYFP